MDRPALKISPLLYGIFFEEINRAGDGGIYAEMIQNRSFEDNDFPRAWKAQKALIALDKSVPLNAHNPTSLRVEVPEGGGGVLNGGFVGDGPRGDWRAWQDYFENQPGAIAVEKGKSYDLSIYVRSQGPATLTIALQGADGKTLASQKFSGLGSHWKQLSASLSPIASDTQARLIISCEKKATFWLDMVSLFPHDTWKGRKNGLRSDLMAKIAAMKPAFVRFPGGCYVEGDEIANRFRWKESIGDIAQRPGHWNLWGYRSTDGLGYHEYLQMCEDLGAEPLFVVNCGMSHHRGLLNAWAEPMETMRDVYVQDALDAIEYANGPATSKWGALRAKNGHPAPFNLKMMEIGNENGGSNYEARYALFHDAIKAKYPEIQLIACDWEGTPRNRTLDYIDSHHYGDFGSFLKQITRFDSYNRSGPKVYFGEYAMTVDAGEGTLQAALGEAAFMTGLERNGDIVRMASYAPLLVRKGWQSWNPNAIHYDQSRSFGTPSYWAQALFANNRSDEVFPIELQSAQEQTPVIKGKIGVGTWGTHAEFKDIKVTKGDRVLFEFDAANGLDGWQLVKGDWKIEDDVLSQKSDLQGALALVGAPDWSNYTLTLKARKLEGNEGFLVTFGSPDENVKSWWNLGGWDNREHGIEAPGINAPRVGGKIEPGRWYDIKIELHDATAKFYLDGELIQSATLQAPQEIAAVAGCDLKTGETILKVVNASAKPRALRIEQRGLSAGKISGRAVVLASQSARDENSFEAPIRVLPQSEQFAAESPDFTRTFPANSITVLRWKPQAPPNSAAFSPGK
jgi:alpha-L-arabinofuranosidase